MTTLDGKPATTPAPRRSREGPGPAPKQREVWFDNPDFPYLFLAALQREATAWIARRAFVVPSRLGPVVLIDVDALDDPIVRSLIERLEGKVNR